MVKGILGAVHKLCHGTAEEGVLKIEICCVGEGDKKFIFSKKIKNIYSGNFTKQLIICELPFEE